VANLTKQQEYLLNRIPKVYEMRNHKTTTEPARVTLARRVIEKFNEDEHVKEKAEEKRLSALVNAAREAVYFKSAEEALKAIKDLEKELS
jgi:hypothetical protein